MDEKKFTHVGCLNENPFLWNKQAIHACLIPPILYSIINDSVLWNYFRHKTRAVVKRDFIILIGLEGSCKEEWYESQIKMLVDTQKYRALYYN